MHYVANALFLAVELQIKTFLIVTEIIIIVIIIIELNSGTRWDIFIASTGNGFPISK